MDVTPFNELTEEQKKNRLELYLNLGLQMGDDSDDD